MDSETVMIDPQIQKNVFKLALHRYYEFIFSPTRAFDFDGAIVQEGKA